MNESKNDFAFLPLGGTGEIGMNFNLYRLNGKWLAFDCGIGFGGNDMPEADILVADPDFIARQNENLLGLIITHAHEDHIGAVAYLWPQLRCPIYVTSFGAAVLRRKLREANLLDEVPIHLIKLGSRIQIDEFDLEFIPVTHSIPEAQSVVIRTPYGTVLHTGDWKLDTDPVIGEVTNLKKFAEIGREGVLAMICDSTNVMVKTPPETEGAVRRSLIELIKGLKGRVAVTCFASNVSRVESIAIAAKEANRCVVVIGRSLHNLEVSARESGYLSSVPPFLTERDISDLSDENILFIITGSQGEERSALTRIALDTHQTISLGQGDTVIYSSRNIPGNERAITHVQDNLVRRGVKVITSRDHLVHVSGHASYNEVMDLFNLVKPGYTIPVHGEWIHLSSLAELAEKMGSKPILLEDGDIVRFKNKQVEIVGSAPFGRLAVDGNRLLSMDGNIMIARRRMLFNGVVIGSFAMDQDGHLIADPMVSAPGLLDPNDEESIYVADDFADALEALPREVRLNDEAVIDSAKSILRRILGRKLRKKPWVDAHLLRI